MRTQRPGATLVEVLVVVGVIGVLVGLLLPAVQAARGAAARSGCQNHLRQQALGVHQYHDARGRVPGPRPGPDEDPENNPYVPWLVHILPHLEQEAVWRRATAAYRAAPFSPFVIPPHVDMATVIPVYLCPADGRYRQPVTDRDNVLAAYTGYVNVAGSGPRAWRNGILGMDNSPVRLTDVTDGLANTLLLGERPPPDTLQAGKWYTTRPAYAGWGQLYGPEEHMHAEGVLSYGDTCVGPLVFGPGRTDNPCDRYHFWSLHPGGGNFAFGDASVRFLTHAAAPILPALASRAGGEAVSPP